MRIVTHFSRLVLLLCLLFDNVHCELKRIAMNKRCHREQNKPTEGTQQEKESTVARTKSLPPPIPYLRLRPTLNHTKYIF